jgi:hypothetical protein
MNRRVRMAGIVAGIFAATGSTAFAGQNDGARGVPVETTTFNFAQVGMSYLAFLSGSDPRVGAEVIGGRIYLYVESLPGSDAANFSTNILLPIEVAPDEAFPIVLDGVDLGWSGSGQFEYVTEIPELHGFFISMRFGAETPGFDFNGSVLKGSRIEIDYIPLPTFEPGDMNCDGAVSVGDIGPFVLAVTDPESYEAQFPECDLLNADVNEDGAVSVGDIGAFVSLVTGQ